MAGHDKAEADEWRKRAREWFVLSETGEYKAGAGAFLALAKEAMLLADDIEANRVAPLAPGPWPAGTPQASTQANGRR
jgi:hypothetical protein